MTSADYVAEDPKRAARNGIDGDLGGWDVYDEPLKHVLWQVERRRFDEDQSDSVLGL